MVKLSQKRNRNYRRAQNLKMKISFGLKPANYPLTKSGTTKKTTCMKSYFKNDVILVRYPFADLPGSKVRPAVIVIASLQEWLGFD